MTEATLHEFMSGCRDETLGLCIKRMREYAPERSEEELTADFHIIIDEIVRALQQNAGLPAHSPLPGKSPTATKHGGQRQLRGYAIETLARDFGSISDVVGELAANQGLSFDAHEYRTFNLCIDSAIGSALEEFSSQAQRQYEHQTAQRVGFLAHELRNALSSARMAFVMLQRGHVGIHSKTGDVLERGLKRLGKLIDDVLLAVQLNGGAKVVLMRLRLKELLTEVAQSAVPERNIRMLVEVHELLDADVDEHLIVSALSNLVQNAFKFTKSNGKITLRARADMHDFVVVEVEDECGGLPPGRHEDLFQPFVQHDSKRRGLGLGLAITREAVQAQGGELTVRNIPGQGCVFSVRLRHTTA